MARPGQILVVAALGAAGCNMNRFNANMTAGMFREAGKSLDMEGDVALARDAAPGLLKTIDGLTVVSPENRTLLELTAQGYCAYSFGFLQDELETLAEKDPHAQALRVRASALYHRCGDYGARLLHLGDDQFPDALHKDVQTLAAAVGKLGKDDVPGLFWTGLALASEIDLNRDNMELVAELPKVEVLMQRVVALDPLYYNAGAHLALGLLYSSQGKAMGGDPDKGRHHLDTAIQMTGGKFLMPKVMLARVYAVTMQDRALYEKTLQEVLRTPADVMPEQRLANEIARRKAARYLKLTEELF
jgi:hypothetical protein